MLDVVPASTSTTSDPQGQSVEAAKTPEIIASNPDTGSEGSTQILEKFKGKSFEDVLSAYSNLEKEKGRLSNEVHEAKTRAKQLEEMITRTPAPAPQPVMSQPVKTLEDEYAEEWEKDPRSAVINLARRQQEAIAQTLIKNKSEEFYTTAKSGALKGYEDFAELEPIMTQVAPHFIDILNPQLVGHPKVIQALHLIARGITRDAALEKARSEGASRASIKQSEKEKAFVESSASAGSDTVDFKSLTLPEMRKLLPKVPIGED